MAYTCQSCNLSFCDVETLISHIKTQIHQTRGNYTCNICMIHALCKSNLIQHDKGYRHSTSLQAYALKSERFDDIIQHSKSLSHSTFLGAYGVESKKLDNSSSSRGESFTCQACNIIF